MKIFTLFALAAIIAASPAEARQKRAITLGKTPTMAADAKGPRRFMSANAQSNPLWRSTIQKAYGWNNEDFEWELSETVTYAYDANGYVVSETIEDVEGYLSRETYTRNAEGLYTYKLTEEKEPDGEWENCERVERTYDSRLTSVITANRQWIWEDGDWMLLGNCYNRTITRNAQGNVTAVEIAVLYQGAYDPTQRIDIEYGDNGKATKIEETHLVYDENYELVWEIVGAFENIVWERTDGQFASTDDLFYGNNRIASATFFDGEGGELDFDIEYDGADYELHATGISDDEEVEIWQSFTQLENDGFKLNNRTDYKVDGQVYYTEIERHTEEYDDYGLLLLIETIFSDGTYEELEDRMRGEVDYDPANGYPLIHVVEMYDYDLDAMINLGRTDFEGYVDVTAGISGIGTDATDAPVEYYNLQGMRIAEPRQGELYIRRQGSEATKIIF